MRARLAVALVGAALLGACSAEAGDGGDLSSVEDRAADAASAEPTASPPVDPPDLRLLLLESDALPTEPGAHDLVVTTVEEDGRRTDRGVRIHVPEGNGPHPVIFALHPFGSDGRRFEGSTGLGAAGAEAGAIVVLPDGVDGAWNASITCCQPAVGDERPDVEFIVALLDAMSATFEVDVARVGATGFSNGGHLAYRLACDTGAFTAIAPVAGTMDRPCAAPSAVSVLHFHGVDDQVIPMVDDRAPFTPGAESRGARHVVDFWARRGGCDVPDAKDLTASWTYDNCEPGNRAELVAVPNLGHLWPTTVGATARIIDFLLAT